MTNLAFYPYIEPPWGNPCGGFLLSVRVNFREKLLAVGKSP